MARTVPFSQARIDLTELVDDVSERHEHVIITRKGVPAAVLLSPADYEALQETVEVLQDTELMEALRRSEQDVRAGRVTPLKEIKRRRRIA
jgi:prevent-host-death family protein